MAQIQKGYEYDSTIPAKNVVTDDNLNALVSNATLLSGAITEQAASAITADSDVMLLSKSGSLIKQTKGQFTDTLNSNIANINTVNAGLIDADDVETVDATLTGNLAVGGNSAITGNLSISGNISGNLAVTGLVTASTAPTVGGHLTNKTYVDGTFVTATKGYVKLPNGIIFQWGASTSIAAGGTQVQTFQTPFPTACLNVQATKITTNDYFGDRKDTHAVFAFTTTGFTMFNQHEMVAATYNWFAIGY